MNRKNLSPTMLILLIAQGVVCLDCAWGNEAPSTSSTNQKIKTKLSIKDKARFKTSNPDIKFKQDGVNSAVQLIPFKEYNKNLEILSTKKLTGSADIDAGNVKLTERSVSQQLVNLVGKLGCRKKNNVYIIDLSWSSINRYAQEVIKKEPGSFKVLEEFLRSCVPYDILDVNSDNETQNPIISSTERETHDYDRASIGSCGLRYSGLKDHPKAAEKMISDLCENKEGQPALFDLSEMDKERQEEIKRQLALLIMTYTGFQLIVKMRTVQLLNSSLKYGFGGSSAPIKIETIAGQTRMQLFGNALDYLGGSDTLGRICSCYILSTRTMRLEDGILKGTAPSDTLMHEAAHAFHHQVIPDLGHDGADRMFVHAVLHSDLDRTDTFFPLLTDWKMNAIVPKIAQYLRNKNYLAKLRKNELTEENVNIFNRMLRDLIEKGFEYFIFSDSIKWPSGRSDARTLANVLTEDILAKAIYIYVAFFRDKDEMYITNRNLREKERKNLSWLSCEEILTMVGELPLSISSGKTVVLVDRQNQIVFDERNGGKGSTNITGHSFMMNNGIGRTTFGASVNQILKRLGVEDPKGFTNNMGDKWAWFLEFVNVFTSDSFGFKAYMGNREKPMFTTIQQETEHPFLESDPLKQDAIDLIADLVGFLMQFPTGYGFDKIFLLPYESNEQIYKQIKDNLYKVDLPQKRQLGLRARRYDPMNNANSRAGSFIDGGFFQLASQKTDDETGKKTILETVKLIAPNIIKMFGNDMEKNYGLIRILQIVLENKHDKVSEDVFKQIALRLHPELIGLALSVAEDERNKQLKDAKSSEETLDNYIDILKNTQTYQTEALEIVNRALPTINQSKDKSEELPELTCTPYSSFYGYTVLGCVATKYSDAYQLVPELKKLSEKNNVPWAFNINASGNFILNSTSILHDSIDFNNEAREIFEILLENTEAGTEISGECLTAYLYLAPGYNKLGETKGWEDKCFYRLVSQSAATSCWEHATGRYTSPLHAILEKTADIPKCMEKALDYIQSLIEAGANVDKSVGKKEIRNKANETTTIEITPLITLIDTLGFIYGQYRCQIEERLMFSSIAVFEEMVKQYSPEIITTYEGQDFEKIVKDIASNMLKDNRYVGEFSEQQKQSISYDLLRKWIRDELKKRKIEETLPKILNGPLLSGASAKTKGEAATLIKTLTPDEIGGQKIYDILMKAFGNCE